MRYVYLLCSITNVFICAQHSQNVCYIRGTSAKTSAQKKHT